MPPVTVIVDSHPRGGVQGHLRPILEHDRSTLADTLVLSSDC